ncbi:hypothetical protein BJ170DRAFT_35725 [Xylariales sp. AK1849]|nr:hypothetical protein BJ170DRAFT_35725 [Xylariales sp. AK1849]
MLFPPKFWVTLQSCQVCRSAVLQVWPLSLIAPPFDGMARGSGFGPLHEPLIGASCHRQLSQVLFEERRQYFCPAVPSYTQELRFDLYSLSLVVSLEAMP